MNIIRHLEQIAFSPDFGRQMRLIAGPRQTGKTTIARSFLEKCGCGKLYYNWDNRQIRDAYRKDNHFFAGDMFNVPPGEGGKRWLCMDEIHKYPDWKNILKDFFDSYNEDAFFVVTGSARLDMMRRSGDSLAGRYLNFRLNPVTLREFSGSSLPEPPDHADDIIREKLHTPVYKSDELAALLRFSGFPEPLVNGAVRFHIRWQAAYMDALVREDLREITQIKNLEKTASLMHLLPERISSPLSINALAGDLNCSFATAANYLTALELGYLIFRLRPYHDKIARSIRKEQKAYFYDWTWAASEAGKFENYVAVELKSLIDAWEDNGLGAFELFYIRDRDGRETDFLVCRNAIPWLLVEVKLSRSSIAYHHKKNRQALGDIPFIQIVREENIAEKQEKGLYQMSASRFFA